MSIQNLLYSRCTLRLNTEPQHTADTVTSLPTQTFRNNRPEALSHNKYSIWGWVWHLRGRTGRIRTGMFPWLCKAAAGVEFLLAKRWRMNLRWSSDFEPDEHTEQLFEWMRGWKESEERKRGTEVEKVVHTHTHTYTVSPGAQYVSDRDSRLNEFGRLTVLANWGFYIFIFIRLPSSISSEKIQIAWIKKKLNFDTPIWIWWIWSYHQTVIV